MLPEIQSICFHVYNIFVLALIVWGRPYSIVRYNITFSNLIELLREGDDVIRPLGRHDIEFAPQLCCQRYGAFP